MLRRSVPARTQATVHARRAGARGVRPFAAVARAASVALAAIGVVLAGGLFLVLLPICGVASIAEGVLRLCLDAVRGARGTARRRGAPSHH